MSTIAGREQNASDKNGGEYVGLNLFREKEKEEEDDEDEDDHQMIACSFLSKSTTCTIWTFVQLAAFLVVLSICYEVSKSLAIIIAIGIFLVAKIGFYQITYNDDNNSNINYQRATTTNPNEYQSTLMSNMDRINREREASEAMVTEAAHMMLEINRQHLDEFLIKNPHTSYENWISDLHPDNVVPNQLETIIIDHRFYVEDSDHRLLWNKTMNDNDREERMLVPATRSLSNTEHEHEG